MSALTNSAAPPGFVVGLAAEARILARALGPSGRIACAGANAERARDGAERLLAEGAGALVSFGIAGGLDPALTPGDLVLAEWILAGRAGSPGGPPIAADPDLRGRWAAAAKGAGLRAVGGRLIESAGILAAAAEKRALFRASGAAAADMESYAVAAVAEKAGVPFAAVRAVADPAGRALPPSVAGIIGADGRPRLGALALRLCSRPWDGPALFALRRDADAALASLGRLAGGFGFGGLS